MERGNQYLSASSAFSSRAPVLLEHNRLRVELKSARAKLRRGSISSILQLAALAAIITLVKSYYSISLTAAFVAVPLILSLISSIASGKGLVAPFFELRDFRKAQRKLDDWESVIQEIGEAQKGNM